MISREADTVMQHSYGDAVEHLRDELECLALMVQGASERTEGESSADAAVDELRRKIALRVQATEAEGRQLPLRNLEQAFRFSQLEIQILLICAAPYAESLILREPASHRFDSFQAPTLKTLFRIFESDLEERGAIIAVLSAHSPLMNYGFLRLGHTPGEDNVSLLVNPLLIDERIVCYLTGQTFADPILGDFSGTMISEESLESNSLEKSILAGLEGIFNGLSATAEDMRPPVFHFHGPSGFGKKRAVAALCNSLGVSLLHLDLRLLAEEDQDFPRIIGRLQRELLLFQQALLISHWEILDDMSPLHRRLRDTLVKTIARHSALVFIISEKKVRLDLPENVRHATLAFSMPDASSRAELWRSTLEDLAPNDVDRIDHAQMGETFELTGGRIRRLVRETLEENTLLYGTPALNQEELLRKCRDTGSRKLSSFGRKTETRHQWDDLILPVDRIKQLKELLEQIKHRHIVCDAWNLESRHPTGRGLHALFSGSPGTGKTMAAGIIARELKRDMYRIDLSSIVSKYIGETEKNLEKIFNEARGSSAILFFDEADALFGKRSEVRDAQDRYANQEVGYLLQKMDEFPGIAILATNLRENMDEAFTRRLRIIIDFPFPDAVQREAIWRRFYPAETPIHDDIDFELLAAKLQVPGGNISNIAVNAAYLAVVEEKPVGMLHILRAAQREYEKESKPFLARDFGDLGAQLEREIAASH